MIKKRLHITIGKNFDDIQTNNHEESNITNCSCVYCFSKRKGVFGKNFDCLDAYLSVVDDFRIDQGIVNHVPQ